MKKCGRLSPDADGGDFTSAAGIDRSSRAASQRSEMPRIGCRELARRGEGQRALEKRPGRNLTG